MTDVLVKFRYRERDIADALRLRMTSTLRKRPETVLALVAFVAGCVVSYVIAPGLVRIIAVGLVAAIVLVVASVLFIVPRVVFRRREGFHVPVTLDASDEGLTVVRGVHAETIAWADARVETNARIHVIQHGDEVLLVPRRAFRNAQREKAFFERLSGSAP